MNVNRVVTFETDCAIVINDYSTVVTNESDDDVPSLPWPGFEPMVPIDISAAAILRIIESLNLASSCGPDNIDTNSSATQKISRGKYSN